MGRFVAAIDDPTVAIVHGGVAHHHRMAGLGQAMPGIGLLQQVRAEQDELAGALMAVSLYYWEVGGPFLILVAWWAYRERRRRVFAGLGMITFAL